MTYPVMDLLLLGQAAQSESHQQVIMLVGSECNQTPLPTDPFKYLITLVVASICDFLGDCMNWLKVCTA